MVRKLFVAVSIFILSFVVLYLFYKLSSIDCYLKARVYVSKMSENLRIEAERLLYGEPEKGIYSGILAGIWKHNVQGIWLWTKGGLKFFTISDKTVYSYFDGCTDEGKFKFASLNGSVTVDREFIFELEEFDRASRRCDYVTIRIDAGGESRNRIWELWGNDWWLFRKTSMQEQCKK